MEEADALSDKIAILNHGELKCYGSPLYLKNLNSSGYKLTLAKADNFNEESVENVLREHLANYEMETNQTCEVSFKFSEQETAKLPLALEVIDKRKKELGIESYGISYSTIEEVFFK